VHLKGLNCFLRRPPGRITRALDVSGPTHLDLLRADRVPMGSLRCDFGEAAGRSRVFRIDGDERRVPAQAVLLDFGSEAGLRLVHQPAQRGQS
jgi:hypothetical protein